jgi:hypothetical protein
MVSSTCLSIHLYVNNMEWSKRVHMVRLARSVVLCVCFLLEHLLFHSR